MFLQTLFLSVIKCLLIIEFFLFWKACLSMTILLIIFHCGGFQVPFYYYIYKLLCSLLNTLQYFFQLI